MSANEQKGLPVGSKRTRDDEEWPLENQEKERTSPLLLEPAMGEPAIGGAIVTPVKEKETGVPSDEEIAYEEESEDEEESEEEESSEEESVEERDEDSDEEIERENCSFCSVSTSRFFWCKICRRNHCETCEAAGKFVVHFQCLGCWDHVCDDCAIKCVECREDYCDACRESCEQCGKEDLCNCCMEKHVCE
jgi:hypothetical protein